eukprot:GHVU01219323.1.p1 GENE.GHVU01219323.1~~GHVU01219323.1.p1  ORF type:complete len:125 (+),score=5.20 GHVU01219323.1:150-524(+)
MRMNELCVTASRATAAIPSMLPASVGSMIQLLQYISSSLSSDGCGVSSSVNTSLEAAHTSVLPISYHINIHSYIHSSPTAFNALYHHYTKPTLYQSHHHAPYTRPSPSQPASERATHSLAVVSR